MKRTQIYLSEEQHELLRRMAFEQRISISQVIRDVVDRFYRNASSSSKASATAKPASQKPTEVRTRKAKEDHEEIKEKISKVLTPTKIDEVREVTESLKGIVSEERYKQLTTALEEYRKSLEDLSKYS